MASRDINLLNPTVKRMAQELVNKAESIGIPLGISATYRSIKEQNELYEQGRTKPGKKVTNVRGGRSYHNYGLAFDVFINRKGSEYDSALLAKVGKLGQQIGLEWGGSWTSFKDTPHFQKTFGLSITQLLNGELPPGGIIKGDGTSSGNQETFILKRGSRGSAVTNLQQSLIKLGYSITADGIFGEATEEAVKDFQRNNRLEADGIIGENTKNKLIEKSPSQKVVVLRRGDRGDDVKRLQRKLLYIGYRIEIDSSFGENTEAVVKLMQKNNSITADGIVGNNTISVINKMIDSTKRDVITWGSKGNDTQLAQKILISYGYNIVADGIAGQATTAAIMKFQEAVGLNKDGAIDRNTWIELIK